MVLNEKQLECCLACPDELEKFLFADVMNVHQVCSAKFEPTLRKIALQGLNCCDNRAICNVLRVVEYLGKQNQQRGIQLLFQAGLHNILDRILLGAYELLNRTEFDAETVLKNFMEALIIITPLSNRPGKWLLSKAVTLLKIVAKCYLQLQISFMMVDSYNLILASFGRENIYAIRNEICSSVEGLDLCKKLVTGLHELGDYTTQFSIIELVVRLTPSSVRVREALEWNQKNETLANLFVNITYESFDQTVREYLNAVNRNAPERRVFSFPANTISFGTVHYNTHCWIHLCLGSRKLTISFTVEDEESLPMCESIGSEVIADYRIEERDDIIVLMVSTCIPLKSLFGDETVGDSRDVAIAINKQDITDYTTFTAILNSTFRQKLSEPVVVVFSSSTYSRCITDTPNPLHNKKECNFSQDLVLNSQPRMKESKPDVVAVPLPVKQKRTRRRHQGRKLELKEVVVDNKYPEPSSRPQKTSCDVRAPRSTERKAPVDKSSLLDRGCVAGGSQTTVIPETQVAVVRLNSSRDLHLSQLETSFTSSAVDDTVSCIQQPAGHDNSINKSEESISDRCENARKKASRNKQEADERPKRNKHPTGVPMNDPLLGVSLSIRKDNKPTLKTARKDSGLVATPACENLYNHPAVKTNSDPFGPTVSSVKRGRNADAVEQSNTGSPFKGSGSTKKQSDTKKVLPSSFAPPTAKPSSIRRKAATPAQVRNGNDASTCKDHQLQTPSKSRPSDGEQASSGAKASSSQCRRSSRLQAKSIPAVCQEERNPKPSEIKSRKKAQRKIKPVKKYEVDELSLPEDGEQEISLKVNTCQEDDPLEMEDESCTAEISKPSTKSRRRMSVEAAVAAIFNADLDKEISDSPINKSPLLKDSSLVQKVPNKTERFSSNSIHKKSADVIGKKNMEDHNTSDKKLRFSVDAYKFTEEKLPKSSVSKRRKRSLFESSGVSSAASPASDLSWIQSHKQKSKKSALAKKLPRTFGPKRKQVDQSIISHKQVDQPITTQHDEPMKSVSDNDEKNASSLEEMESPQICREEKIPSPVDNLPPLVLNFSHNDDTFDAKSVGSKTSLVIEPWPVHIPPSCVSTHRSSIEPSPHQVHSRSFIVGSQCSHISTVKTPDCNLGMNDSILEEKKEDDTESQSEKSEKETTVKMLNEIQFQNNSSPTNQSMHSPEPPKLSSKSTPAASVASNSKEKRHPAMKLHFNQLTKKPTIKDSRMMNVSLIDEEEDAIEIQSKVAKNETSGKILSGMQLPKSSSFTDSLMHKLSPKLPGKPTSVTSVASSSSEKRHLATKLHFNRPKKKTPMKISRKKVNTSGSEMFSNLVVSVEKNIRSVHEEWKKFSIDRTSKFEDFRERFSQCAATHIQLMKKMREVENETIQRLRCRQQTFECLLDESKKLSLDVKEINSEHRCCHEQQEKEFSAMMSDLSREISDDLQRLLRAT